MESANYDHNTVLAFQHGDSHRLPDVALFYGRQRVRTTERVSCVLKATETGDRERCRVVTEDRRGKRNRHKSTHASC